MMSGGSSRYIAASPFTQRNFIGRLLHVQYWLCESASGWKPSNFPGSDSVMQCKYTEAFVAWRKLLCPCKLRFFLLPWNLHGLQSWPSAKEYEISLYVSFSSYVWEVLKDIWRWGIYRKFETLFVKRLQSFGLQNRDSGEFLRIFVELDLKFVWNVFSSFGKFLSLRK